MKAQAAAPGDAWRLDQGPFIFSGVPPLCVGELGLINESDEKVKVRAIPLVRHKDQALPSAGLAELRVGTRVLPRDRTRVRAHFLLDPYTPPGTYTADLACGSQRERVILHVWEKQGVRIEPRPIRLRGAGGETLKSIVVVSNEGNVTETLRDLALVYLEERNWVGRSLVYAMRETSVEDGHQAYLDRLFKELRGTLARPARVTLRSEVSELHPGETREVELAIKLPAELVKGRTYIGSTPFMSSSLIFRVECNGVINSTKRRPR